MRVVLFFSALVKMQRYKGASPTSEVEKGSQGLGSDSDLLQLLATTS